MILSAAPTPPTSQGATRARRAIVPWLLLALIVVTVAGTGVAYVDTAKGATHFACISVSSSGNTVTVTTTGLLHLVNGQYYISCSEGSSLPTGNLKSSCLTISAQVEPATIGVGASTEYYYISSSSSSAIALNGAAALANGGEIIDMAGVSLSVSC
jgi:hypothetical protein